MDRLSIGLITLGGIFNVVLLLMIAISSLLIYSLLMVTVDEKVFTNGVMRMVGVSRSDCLLTITMQSLTFVIPSIIVSYGAAVAANHYLLETLYTPEMGLKMSALPDWYSTVQAVAVGFLIPLISSILPMQKVLSLTINESLNTQRNKSTTVEITEDGKVDKTPYLAFGALSVIYGVSIFVLLPMALLDFNIGLLLMIFFLILLGMIFGLSLLATNI